MNRVEEVAIVGGGPSGAYCAFQLAKEGMHPVIFDHSHPREKPCGGGISPPVIEKFPFVERFRQSGFTFGDFRVISCIDTQVRTKGLENGFSISRLVFDQGILDLAIESGARLIKEKVTEVQTQSNLWIVKTEKSVHSTRVLVGADGVNSLVRRQTVGSISKENLALTYGYFANQLSKYDATIKFLAEIPGYIWVFPGKTYSNIGIGSELRNGNMLKGLLDTFVRLNYPATKILSSYSAMLPSASSPEFFKLPCASDSWILIGDAAGHVDPISGGGILYALWGAQLAAQAISRNDPKSFDTSWRKEFGQILEERCRNKDAFYDPLRSTASILFGLARASYFWPTA